jgi:hypothetical protein
MVEEEVASCLGRQAPGGERPCVRCCRAAHDVKASRFGLLSLLRAASWQEAHVSGQTDHNRLVGGCDNMGFLERRSSIRPAGATVVED